jgi:hypothetical protein
MNEAAQKAFISVQAEMAWVDLRPWPQGKKRGLGDMGLLGPRILGPQSMKPRSAQRDR